MKLMDAIVVGKGVAYLESPEGCIWSAKRSECAIKFYLNSTLTQPFEEILISDSWETCNPNGVSVPEVMEHLKGGKTIKTVDGSKEAALVLLVNNYDLFGYPTSKTVPYYVNKVCADQIDEYLKTRRWKLV